MTNKKVLGTSTVHYRGHDLIETERDGKVMVELWFQGREYLFDSLGEATGFLDTVAILQSRVILINDAAS